MSRRDLVVLGFGALILGLAWIYRVPDRAQPPEAQTPQLSADTNAAPADAPALPPAAAPEAETEGAAERKLALQPVHAATLRGTIQMNGEAYERARVVLRKSTAIVPTLKAVPTRPSDDDPPLWLDDQAASTPSPPNAQSDANGRFVFEGLEAGDYNLIAHHARGATKVAGFYRLQAGEERDIGTLDLPPPSAEWTARMAAALIPPARVRVETGTAGLFVRVTTESAHYHNMNGNTLEDGVYNFKCESTQSVYIDLLNAEGFLVATTGAYESFAPDAETIVELIPTSGSLDVELPSDWALASGQAIQCLLTLESTLSRDPVVETLRTDAARAAGLHFATLLPGDYTIEAIFIDISPEGRWLARSRRATGRIQIQAGHESRCLLK